MKAITPICPRCGYNLSGLGLGDRSCIVCPECGSEASEESLRTGYLKRRRMLWVAMCFAVCAVCMYAPFTWLFFLDGSWGSHRWSWVRMYGGLPALLPGTIIMRGLDLGDADDGWGLVAIHAASMVTLIGLAWAASRRWWLFSVIVPALLLFSILNGIAAYHAYRM